MDEQRFDQLSRRLAGFRTRRQVLKALAGAVAASVAGTRAADAQSCTSPYSACSSDGQCCPGAVCEYGLCMPGCRIDGAFTSAWMSPPDNICGQCRPEISTTSWSPANEGMSCWSGDPNAGITTCQNGVCAGSVPVDCRPQTACHTAAINPATGQCQQSFAPAGTACGGPEMCHGGFYQPADTCDGNGFCIGGGSKTVSCAPYVCGQDACATSCITDGECAAGASCCGGSCGWLDSVDHCGACGNACAAIDDCTPAECVNGVCRQTSVCTPVDACTPAVCLDNGACNQVSACVPVDACTPAGCVDGQCITESVCGSGHCDGSACVECFDNAHCASLSDECNVGVCSNATCERNPVDGSCGEADSGVCTDGECVQTCAFPEAGTTVCTSDGDCDTGEVCKNGGCFMPCPSAQTCGDGCVNCWCSLEYANTDNDRYCTNTADGTDRTYGVCTTGGESACPAGTMCNVSYNPPTCTRPCPKLITPV